MTPRAPRLLPIAALLVRLSARAAEPVVDFVVVKSDTLIGLSSNVLVSPAAWREVATLNRLPNPNRIVPGQLLRIPTRLLRSLIRAARKDAALEPEKRSGRAYRELFQFIKLHPLDE